MRRNVCIITGLLYSLGSRVWRMWNAVRGARSRWFTSCKISWCRDRKELSIFKLEKRFGRRKSKGNTDRSSDVSITLRASSLLPLPASPTVSWQLRHLAQLHVCSQADDLPPPPTPGARPQPHQASRASSLHYKVHGFIPNWGITSLLLDILWQ